MSVVTGVFATSEDCKAWAMVHLRNDELWMSLRRGSRDSDRRDAQLMRSWGKGFPIDLGFADDEGTPVFWYGPVSRL
jgi:hypothetical protein